LKAKIVGILGGMGPEATLDLYGKIIRATPATKDQDHLRVIIDSNPMVPDRTPAIIANGENPVPTMLESGKVLERAGVDFIIIPCISAHFFLDELQRHLKVPILSAFDAVAEKISKKFPDVKTVGLISTTGTIQGGKFAQRLLQSSIATVVPVENDQKTVMDAIYNIKGTQNPDVRRQCKADLLRVSQNIIKLGAQGIIAGCTEIPLELKAQDLPVAFFNPLHILAETAVREAQSVDLK
jgi:aspartate racemase